MGEAALDPRETVVERQDRFASLVRRYGPQIRAYCARRVDADSVEDVTAEVFTIAWSKFDEVPSDAELAWLYGVAYRRVSEGWRVSQRKRRLRERLFGLGDGSPVSVEDEVVTSEDHARVLEAASRLRPVEQEILRLTLWEELSHGEVAEVLGLRVDAVKQRASRARRALAEEYVRLLCRSRTSPGSEGGGAR